MRNKSFKIIEISIIISIVLILIFISYFYIQVWIKKNNNINKITILNQINNGIRLLDDNVNILKDSDKFVSLYYSGVYIGEQGFLTNQILKKIGINWLNIDDDEIVFRNYNNNIQFGTFFDIFGYGNDIEDLKLRNFQNNFEKSPLFLGDNLGIFYSNDGLTPLNKDLVLNDKNYELLDYKDILISFFSNEKFLIGDTKQNFGFLKYFFGNKSNLLLGSNFYYDVLVNSNLIYWYKINYFYDNNIKDNVFIYGLYNNTNKENPIVYIDGISNMFFVKGILNNNFSTIINININDQNLDNFFLFDINQTDEYINIFLIGKNEDKTPNYLNKYNLEDKYLTGGVLKLGFSKNGNDILLFVNGKVIEKKIEGFDLNKKINLVIGKNIKSDNNFQGEIQDLLILNKSFDKDGLQSFIKNLEN